mmetsp:Transcript_63155/g.142025  ORF Transcript_63155/g.142025 Transcript_63155/m.142025 type:complete len:287 (+) Transcript_63155:628-1488(+)
MRAGARSTVRLQPGGGTGLGGAEPAPTRGAGTAALSLALAADAAVEPSDEDCRGDTPAAMNASASAFSKTSSTASSNSPFAFFLFCRAFDLFPLPSMNFASSSMLFSSEPLSFSGPGAPAPPPAAALSSARQMTHSKGMEVAESRASQSNELALQTRRNTSTQIHQRLRTSFCPWCFGSSMMSVTICRTQRPRSMRMNSRCWVSRFMRTGPEAIFKGGCLEASLTNERSSNSTYSPVQTTDSPPRPLTSTPTWTCSGSVSSGTRRSVSSELWYLGRPFSLLEKVMM